MPTKTSPWLPSKVAFHELRNDPKFVWLFIINLALGLSGFVLVDSFKTSIQDQIEQKSKAVLGADVSIDARRLFRPAEVQKALTSLPQGTKKIEQIEMYSMAYNGKQSRLVNVIALDENYPLIPGLKLKNKGLVKAQLRKSLDGSFLWASPELLVQLGGKIGGKLQIGEKEFTVADTVSEDPSSSSSGFTLAPKIYMARKSLGDTDLLKLGSRLAHRVLFLLPERSEKADFYAKELHAILPSQDIRIKTHRSASRELNRALILLGENLSLIALMALFLAGIGASYLFKSHLQQQIKDMATLLSLGFSHKQLLNLAVWKVILLSLASGVLLLVLTPIILPAIPWLLKDLSSNEIVVPFSIQTLSYAVAVATGTSLLLCLPTIDLLKQVKPSLLLKEGHHSEGFLSSAWRAALLYLPAVLFFWGLSCWQAKSFVIGSAFSGGFTVASIGLYLVANIFIRICRRMLKNGVFPTKLSWLNLTHIPTSTIVAFLAISLCALLLNIIPHLEATVGSELKYPDNKKPPSLFIFDIQEDQLEGVKDLLAENDTPLESISPLIRARLEKINNQSIERSEELYKNKSTREQEWQNRLKNRTYNLSYRQGLFHSETLIDGRPFSGPYVWTEEKPAEISLEHRFADRLGINIGDTMEFDIQGVSVTGEVVNTRKVKWTSFQPNFFVQFQPGVLDDAPKSFLGSVSSVNFDTKIKTQNITVQKFPNLSIVDVEETLQRISQLMANIISAVKYMTLLAILAGITVIFSIMSHAAQMRSTDYQLFKMLGITFRDIRIISIIELFSLIVTASLFGFLISIAMTTFLTQFILDEFPVFNWTYSILSTFAMISIATLTGYISLMGKLGKKQKIAI